MNILALRARMFIQISSSNSEMQRRNMKNSGEGKKRGEKKSGERTGGKKTWREKKRGPTEGPHLAYGTGAIHMPNDIWVFRPLPGFCLSPVSESYPSPRFLDLVPLPGLALSPVSPSPRSRLLPGPALSPIPGPKLDPSPRFLPPPGSWGRRRQPKYEAAA